MPLLSRDDGMDETCMAWHRQYFCTSVKSCKQRNPDIIAPWNHYNKVPADYFQKIKRKAGQQEIPPSLKSLDDELKQRTLK